MVSYSLETIRGVITSEWKKEKNNYELNVTIPVNSKAKVYIPTFGLSGVSISEGKNILWDNGSIITNSEEISFDKLEGEYPSATNYVVFNIGSGTYRFEAKW